MQDWRYFSIRRPPSAWRKAESLNGAANNPKILLRITPRPSSVIDVAMVLEKSAPIHVKTGNHGGIRPNPFQAEALNLPSKQ